MNYTRNEQAVDKKKTEKALAVLALFFALIIAALGLFEMNEYRDLINDCTSETVGYVDSLENGNLGYEGNSVAGKYLSTGRSRKYWIKIIVNTDGVFKLKTLYAGRSYGKEGDEIIIRYNPYDPEEYYIGEYVDNIKTSTILFFVFAGGLVLLSVFLLIHSSVIKDSGEVPQNSYLQEQKSEKRIRKVEKRLGKYARYYTNAFIRKQILDDSAMLSTINVVIIINILLIASSFVLAYRDMHADNPIPYNNFPSTLNESYYCVEITDRPKRVYGSLYDVKEGSNHILVNQLDYGEIVKQDDASKVRGKLRRIRISKDDIRKSVKEYYKSIGYLDSLKDEEYAYYYLDCTKSSLWDETRENHALGLSFGIVIIIVIFVMIRSSGALNMRKHRRPACSDRIYRADEINMMANDPYTVWNNKLHILVTPTALIGLNKGITVVEYKDIASIESKKRSHSENRRRSYTYLLIIKTKTNKKMVLTEVENESGCDSLISLVAAKCYMGRPV